MIRPSASSRRYIGLGLAVAVSTGIGLGAYSLGSAAGTDTVNFPRVGAAAATATSSTSAEGTAAAGTSPEPSASAPLTLDEAMEIAIAAAPGRVIEWDEDQEPAGLRYDVTLLHDNGSTTDVEVDTVTGQVTSIDHDVDGD
jgi:uncharacterized membrane protein YkoI